ncbi:hypothetical protein BC835DRAFT_234854 [Cytidiella melzeri]|nr:hypothetical protein BC835DRAFT_234854 [Cytidiella melzeri]
MPAIATASGSTVTRGQPPHRGIGHCAAPVSSSPDAFMLPVPSAPHSTSVSRNSSLISSGPKSPGVKCSHSEATIEDTFSPVNALLNAVKSKAAQKIELKKIQYKTEQL